MKKLLLALALLTSWTPALAASADPALLSRIQQTYGKLDSFTADFTQVLKHKESGSTEKRSGRLQFQKPLLIRWETDKPNQETLIVNEKEIWDYLPDEEIAYRYAPGLVQDSASIIKVLTGQAKLDRDFNVKDSGMDKNLRKLTLFPKDPTPQMVEAEIWIDPDTGIIQRASVIDFYGNVNDVAFKSFNKERKIAAGTFGFKPPKGVEVENRVDKGLQERQLFK